MPTRIPESATPDGERARGWRFARRAVRIAARSPLALVGTVLVVGFVVLAALSPWITPHDPLQENLGGALQSSTFLHPLGTDDLGRDVLSRLLAASRTDLFIACVGILCAVVLGVPLGLVAGYFGGRIDAALSTIIDSLLTFPTLILAVLLVSLLGSGTTSLVLAVTLTASPSIARVARGLAMELRDKEFIEAAKAQGTSLARILRCHLFPNAVSQVVVVASVLASQSILTVTALGFLGLGVQPPAPEWGNMLVNSRTYLFSQPLLMLYPGLAISGFILGINLIGDMLRDVLDVRTPWNQ